MQANKRSLGEILSSDIRLVAPLFQRPYVWNLEDNWEPLWQALQEVFERKLNDQPERPYFMGALVLANFKGATGAVPSREIIDGQQRMTTLQIFMEIAKGELKSNDLNEGYLLLERLTRNILGSNTDHQFKVWPTNIDREQFRRAMTGEPADGKMREAVQFFQHSVRKWLDPVTEGFKDRANALVGGVIAGLVFVVIDLDGDDDGQLIFETLNSLGAPLLPSDLVKNLLFREATAAGADTEQLYNQYWLEFERESDYWREKIKVGRRERPRLDVFLQYYLTYKLSKEPVLAHQFRDYRDAFRDGKLGSTEEAMADFANHARLFKQFDNAKDGTAGSLRHVLWVLDASVPNPLILGIYANAASIDERDAMLQIVESYLIRRFLCGVTTKRYNLIIADIVSKLKNDGWAADVLRSALLAFEGNSSVWPDDGFVKWRVTERDSYNNIRGVGISYVLARVEGSLRTDFNERNWNPRSPLTIEHLMPQQWEQHWPLSNPDDPEAKAKRVDLLDRMGNLTVLTKKLNSSISNGPWQSKRSQLNVHSVLLMNSALAAIETWDEEAIKARGQALSKAFCEIWPR